MKITIEITSIEITPISPLASSFSGKQMDVAIDNYNGQIYHYRKTFHNDFFEAEFEQIWRIVGDDISWDVRKKQLQSRAGK